jgi:hypothetical protein
MADRNEAESLLSESLGIIRESVASGEIQIKVSLIDRLSDITEKIRSAIAIHLEAVTRLKICAQRRYLRFFTSLEDEIAVPLLHLKRTSCESYIPSLTDLGISFSGLCTHGVRCLCT